MTSNRSTVRRTALAAATTAAALLLAACGSDGSTAGGHTGHGSTTPSASAPAAPAATGQHNDADAVFAAGMIPHHRQAVVMAELAGTRAASPEVKTLAGEIKKAQDPEIATMTGWLRAWGEPVPQEGAAMEHAGHGMAGMMTPGEMANLEKSSGAAFDKAFLELMVKHHEGAVEMARTEKAQGRHPEAKKLAEAVITTQSAEIARMKKLLAPSS
ncbi:DUF305 domain-containing protein [Streptomyces sp. NPDC101118]|uniref:DUF305 domain-containing protein n=1 Tax=Streptomyces sp. NPDC101118 TaxID=3366109 RepID=UPI00381AC494